MRAGGSGAAGVGALAVEGGAEVRQEAGAILVEGGKVGGGGELKPEGGTGHEGTRGDDQKDQFGVGDGALETIPEGRRESAKFGGRRVAEVEHDEAEVGIAGKKIGDAQGGGGVAAAGPDEVGQ